MDAPVIDLDHEDYLTLARNNPTSVVGRDPIVFIDEYQKVPALLDAIKARLNWETRPGMFVLAGSASYDSLPRGTQALTGRVERLPIMPLTQTDRGGSRLMSANLLNPTPVHCAASAERRICARY